MPDEQPPSWSPEPPEDWPPPSPGAPEPSADDPGTSRPLPPPPAPPGGYSPHVRPEPPPPASAAVPQGAAAAGQPPAPPYVPAAGPKRRGHGCLIAIAVFAAVLLLGVGGCVFACRGAFSDSIHTRTWGWDGADGPGLQSDISMSFGTSPLPQDTAPPDPAKDIQAEGGLRRIHDGLSTFAQQNGRAFDQARDGSWEVALQPYVQPWPRNPWTGQPMHAGDHRGDVKYETTSGKVLLVVNISP